MLTKQVSVFLENKSGRLSEVVNILGASKINISAFSVADTSDFGVLRMIVNNPEKACKILKENQFSVRTTNVVLAKSKNEPGALSKLLEILNSENVFIEYLYAFSMDSLNAIIVIRPSDTEKCVKTLEKHSVELLSKNGNYSF